jgi:hypothetical protein
VIAGLLTRADDAIYVGKAVRHCGGANVAGSFCHMIIYIHTCEGPALDVTSFFL